MSSEHEQMTASQWVAGFAARLGVEAPDERAVEQLLEIAAVAAHQSERVAAPIACHLVGRAGLDPGAALELARDIGTGQAASSPT
jgi:hypothetical protein